MPLLGPAVVVVSFDIEPASVVEHDEWHSREHMPERLSIPGFRRGTRWRNESGSPGYLVIYEVADTGVLTSDAYLQRLNGPTPWTRAVMKSYRNMTRGLCAVVASVGQGLGGTTAFAWIDAAPGREDELRRRLAEDAVPRLAARRGALAAHLIEATVAAPTTAEQRIRGRDAEVRFALLVTGYDDVAITGLLDADLRHEGLPAQDAGESSTCVGRYRLAAALTHEETLAAYGSA